ncbi:MAG: response regulator [Thermodesulforhabdaceae bacterium]|jgi:DNA-binding NtrC family response regulator
MDSIKLLLVDDEELFVETVARRLERRNIKVLTAFSGEEALKILESNQDTDVVILDVKMPGMDGITVLREIKQRYPLMEVIMLTGYATVESAVQGMKLGAFDYLMKPCEIDDLVKKAQEAAEKKRQHLEKIREAAIRHALSSYVD